MRCGFCPQEKAVASYKGPRLMTVENFKNALSNAGPIEQVSFAGFAEPFLNPRATTMVEWATMVTMSVVIYTTGIGMTLEDVERLKVRPLDWITLHLPDADGCMKFDPTDEYVAVVESLLKSGQEIRLMAMGPVHPMLESLIRGRDVGSNESMQSRAGNVSLPQTGRISPGTGLRLDRFVAVAKRGALKCSAAPDLDHPVMLPDGSLVVCCQDWSLEHRLGNLVQQTWDEIYAGEAFARLKESMKDGPCLCRGCEYAVGAE